ncbi:MAG: glycosyltransferase [Nannocystis sp.]|uniref:glycosyltransferase n=1 Tax=Nannocystis sp. TaxID=1962667 RepID=UPI0024228D66|nr:glycosyltransferase [Nannocystis sp.]MBK9755412.1 glycosyltransferase [Nannocystis sp.]
MSPSLREPALSIVLPLREGAAIPELYIAVTTACERLDRYYELLLVDDGARDGSSHVLDALVDEDPRVRVVHLRRRMGRPIALAAGLARVRGDIVLTLEADDDDPAMIADFVARIDAGADIVTGWRQRPGVGPDLRSRLLRRLAEIELHDPSCGLRAYRRSCLLALPQPPGGERFLPLLAHTQGFRVEELVVHPRDPKRRNDEGGLLAALADLLQIVLLTRHPHRPLRLLAVPGLLCAAGGLLLLLLAPFLGALAFALGLLAAIVGSQLVIAGVLAEQLASSRAPAHYAVRDEREASDEARAAFASGTPRPITAPHRPTAQPQLADPHLAAPNFPAHPTYATPGPATGPTRTVVAPVVPTEISIAEDDEDEEDSGPATVALDRNPFRPSH